MKRAAKIEPQQDPAASTPSEGRRSLMRLLSLWPYVARYKLSIVGAALALIASAMGMLSIPIVMQRLIDDGVATGRSSVTSNYFILMIIVGLIISIGSACRFYLVNLLGERVVADLRRDIFRHLTTLGPAFVDRNHTGELISRLTVDTAQVRSAAGQAISQLARNTIMLVGAVAMMLVTSLQLTIIVLVAIPLIVLPLYAFGRFVRGLTRRALDSDAMNTAFVGESLSAVRTMLAYTNERVVNTKFSEGTDRALAIVRQRLRARALLTGLAVFLVFSSILVVLWYGASQSLAGAMTFGTLGRFMIYTLLAGGAFAELAEVWGEVNQTAGATDRIMGLLAEKPLIAPPQNPVAMPKPAIGDITFERVSFEYPARPGVQALDDVSFRVAAGETVAVVGPSGAGKSTILSLVLRFYDPTKGRVLVDGVSVADADLTDLRSRLGFVPQDVAIFDDTVFENIAYGTPGATHEKVTEAAIAAQADGFVRALPNGYETRLGERGVTLSGGERQRIAIARAILRNAPILLLDEATSALDAESEHDVQSALDRVMAGRTTLVIAHRLATIQRASRILVVDGGRIVEQGTHAQLIRSGGLYSRLATLQFDGAKAAAE